MMSKNVLNPDDVGEELVVVEETVSDWVVDDNEVLRISGKNDPVEDQSVVMIEYYEDDHQEIIQRNDMILPNQVQVI